MAEDTTLASNHAAIADLRPALSPLRRNALTKARTGFMSCLSAEPGCCDCKGDSVGLAESLRPR